MATKFQDVVSGVITGVFIKKALENDSLNDFDLIYKECLFMSSLEQSCHPSLLIRHKITHVLSVCQAKNAYEKGLEEAFGGLELDEKNRDLLSKWKEEWRDIQYYRIAIADKPKVNISSRFGEAIDYIDKVLSNSNNRLLLHCQAGISRSGTICIAYLMSKGMTLEQAFLFARSKRAIIRPNKGFANALLQYNEELYPGTESPEFRKALGLELAIL